mmetsp:Transcript_83789/g.242313  ORF Transcript_83789/g.242313 Transcript_83789/m.242313 type:complete len:293 (-) Transcript_83789:2843-3721(-)
MRVHYHPGCGTPAARRSDRGSSAIESRSTPFGVRVPRFLLILCQLCRLRLPRPPLQPRKLAPAARRAQVQQEGYKEEEGEEKRDCQGHEEKDAELLEEGDIAKHQEHGGSQARHDTGHQRYSNTAQGDADPLLPLPPHVRRFQLLAGCDLDLRLLVGVRNVHGVVDRDADDHDASDRLDDAQCPTDNHHETKRSSDDGSDDDQRQCADCEVPTCDKQHAPTEGQGNSDGLKRAAEQSVGCQDPTEAVHDKKRIRIALTILLHEGREPVLDRYLLLVRQPSAWRHRCVYADPR